MLSVPEPTHEMRKRTEYSYYEPERTFVLTDHHSGLEQYNLVRDLHGQLNGLIDQINLKVEGVIEKHENQFLAAYRSHIKKMRKELDEYKASTQKLQSSGSTQLVQLLGKESGVLRDQLSKMFMKLEAKNLEIDRLKLRLDESEKENSFLQAEVKRLLMRIKVEAVGRTLQPPEESISTTVPVRPHSKCQVPANTIKYSAHKFYQKHSRSRNKSMSSQGEDSLQQQLTNVLGTDQQLLERVLKVVQPSLAQKDARYNELRDKYFMQVKQTERTLQTTTARSQLESFFLQCVEDTRKELYRKMQRQLNQTYNESYISFETFKRQDRQKILEKLLENEQVVRLIFDAMFRGKSVTPSIDSGSEQRKEQMRPFRRSLNYKSERF